MHGYVTVLFKTNRRHQKLLNAYEIKCSADDDAAQRCAHGGTGQRQLFVLYTNRGTAEVFPIKRMPPATEASHCHLKGSGTSVNLNTPILYEDTADRWMGCGGFEKGCCGTLGAIAMTAHIKMNQCLWARVAV